jgi:hypothetical protein
MPLAKSAQIDCRVLAVEAELVEAAVQRANDLAGRTLIEIDLQVFVEGGGGSSSAIDSCYLLLALVHLQQLDL